MRAPGFTLVELVVVLALAAILAGLGLGRVADPAPFRARGFAGELAQVVAAGQRLAVAQRRPVAVQLDPAVGTVALCLDATCATPIPPIPGGAALLTAPPGVRLAPRPSNATRVAFDASGNPAPGAPTTVRLVDAAGTDLGAGVEIEPGSGLARTR